MMESTAARLDDGLVQLALELSADQRHALLAFIDLLAKWNKTYNLTALRDPAQMLTHHVFDSLALLPWLHQQMEKSALVTRRLPGVVDVCDVGSGGGLPGLVLAIACPHWRIRSIETVAKKAAFQRQVCIELGLSHVEVVAARVEHQPPAGAGAVISRAFAELADFVRLAGHLIVPGGQLLAMKGVLGAEEMGRIPAGWRAAEVIPITVPRLEAQRHLIVLERA